MTECRHINLVLLAEQQKKLRCNHCHLTISEEELDNSFCPECYETDGKKHYDFENVESETKGQTKYRCEDCGLIIDATP